MLQRLLTFCLALVSLAHAGSIYAQRTDYGFRIEARPGDGRIDFIAHNAGPATLSARATITTDNMRTDTPSITAVVPAFKSRLIGSAYPLEGIRGGNAGITSTVTWGDLHAVHSADARYRLPYENGSTFPISQAFGTPLTTHAHAGAEHAVDFGLPEGTPIVAARDGLIVEITLTHWRGGRDPALKDKANVVQILHDDGTVAMYAHLHRRAAPVKVGERVRAGTLIGYSGDTGYSSGPHLHFAVSRPHVGADGRLRDVALPIVFYAGVPAVEFIPQRGMEVRAVYASQTAPAPAIVASNAPQGADPAPRAEPAVAVAVVTQSAAPVIEVPAPPRALSPPPQYAPAPVAPVQHSAREVAAVGTVAEPATDMTPLYMGVAFLITIFGVLCLLSPMIAGRTSRE